MRCGRAGGGMTLSLRAGKRRNRCRCKRLAHSLHGAASVLLPFPHSHSQLACYLDPCAPQEGTARAVERGYVGQQQALLGRAASRGPAAPGLGGAAFLGGRGSALFFVEQRGVSARFCGARGQARGDDATARRREERCARAPPKRRAALARGPPSPAPALSATTTGAWQSGNTRAEARHDGRAAVAHAPDAHGRLGWRAGTGSHDGGARK